MSFTPVSSAAYKDVLSFPFNITANFLVVALCSDVARTTLSDSNGNTWEFAGSFGGAASGIVSVLYCDDPNTGGGAFSISLPNTYTPAAIWAFDRAAGSLLSTPTAGRQVSSSNNPTAGGLTTANPDTLVMAALGLPNAAGTLTIESPWATREFADAEAGFSYGIGLSYRVVASASTVDPVWTLGTARDAAAALVAFSVIAGSGSASGNASLDPITATGGASGQSSGEASGDASFAAIVATGEAGSSTDPGTVTTLPFTRNNGFDPTGLTGNAIAILSDNTGMTRVTGGTGLSQDGSGRLALTSASLTPTVSYIVVTRESDGTLGISRVTAT
jgi:hypothetical protein